LIESTWILTETWAVYLLFVKEWPHTWFWNVISYLLADVRVRLVRDLYNDCICRIIISSYRLRKVLPLSQKYTFSCRFFMFGFPFWWVSLNADFLILLSQLLFIWYWIYNSVYHCFVYTQKNKTGGRNNLSDRHPFCCSCFRFIRFYSFDYDWTLPMIYPFLTYIRLVAPLSIYILFPHSVERSHAPWSVNNSNKFILCLCIMYMENNKVWM